MAYRDIVGSFWYLHDQAFLKFSRVIQLPHYGVHRYDPDISEAFDLFSKLWKMQKEYRCLLEQNGLERWEIGQIAFRIGQLYVGQYLKNGDTKNLFEAYLSYKAIMDHGYLLDTSINLEIHFLVHFFLLCLMLGRHEMVHLIAKEIKDLYDGFLEEEPMEWKQSFKEIERFHEVDRSFMNMRPLRYSFAFDPHPNSIPNLASGGKERAPILHVAIILGYHPNEVKFGEITLDSLRMLQCLEWEPCGEFAETTRGEGIQGGNSSPNLLQDIRDMSLPPDPQKLIFYRPSITLFLMVIATAWNELPSDKVLLIYLSAGGEGELSPVPSNSRPSSESCGKIMHSFSNIEISYTATSTNKSPIKSSSQRDCSKLQSEPCLWLGPHESEGSNFLYPSDLIPFTRRHVNERYGYH
ncbi:uncharacterized protein [Typha angustifolia]|uniref:uncharacterized protein n=1 Tax=Typha angustifolia TaxID=59011 RepID=UPI003C2C5111